MYKTKDVAFNWDRNFVSPNSKMFSFVAAAINLILPINYDLPTYHPLKYGKWYNFDSMLDNRKGVQRQIVLKKRKTRWTTWRIKNNY